MRKDINTFADYFNDETRVSKEESERINLEAELIGDMIKTREDCAIDNKSVIPL